MTSVTSRILQYDWGQILKVIMNHVVPNSGCDVVFPSSYDVVNHWHGLLMGRSKY